MLQLMVSPLEIITYQLRLSKKHIHRKSAISPGCGDTHGKFHVAGSGGRLAKYRSSWCHASPELYITLFHVTDKMSWSQPRDNWSNYWFARRGRQVCCSSATSSSSAAPSGPGSSISTQDNFHLIITAKIFINCDHDPLSLMSGHSKRYNCPLVRVTAAIDSSLQHSVPENIYCLVG